ncbi:MAG: hypothetical protein EHM45_24825 [Desulfobacteraceae bacterium]|nr:MAG: hypothetical protein EHM45_24825 [Desulfobacteraceae bacterium]
MKPTRQFAERQIGSGLLTDILRYLIAHPEARDTIEGIAHWWLLEQNIQEQLTRIQSVLDDLVAMGLIVEKAGADRRPSYQINAARVEEIKRFLQQEKTKEEMYRH